MRAILCEGINDVLKPKNPEEYSNYIKISIRFNDFHDLETFVDNYNIKINEDSIGNYVDTYVKIDEIPKIFNDLINVYGIDQKRIILRNY